MRADFRFQPDGACRLVFVALKDTVADGRVDVSVRVSEQLVDGVGRVFRVDGLRIETGELLGLIVDAVYSVGGTNPNVLMTVFCKTANIVVAQCGGVVYLILIDFELISVEPIGPVACSEPDVTV